MCRCETGVRIRGNATLAVTAQFAVAAGLLAAFVLPARAQLAADQNAVWKRIAGTTVNEGLAGPASGPVQAVWYAAAGKRLLVQTAAGRIFETGDFEHWKLNTTDPAPVGLGSVFQNASATLPEAEARVQAASARLYAAGKSNVYASDDNGRTWLNLTGFNNRSIVGGGFSALAVSPVNALEISAANQFGVWRSIDGGLSWRGVNDDLPNLTVRRLLTRRLAVLADSTLVGFEAGSWSLLSGADPELASRSRFASQTGLKVSALAQGGGILYIGSADGKLYASRDNGASWTESLRPAGASIDRIWVDGDRPESALAASGTRLLRTINGGGFWEDVTGTLPQTQIHGMSADRSSSVVYVATDRGVFAGTLSLNDAGPAPADWKSVSRDLPAGVAWDVRLNPDNTLTVALDGYGVFETAAPHRSRTVRLVNSADMTDRPAAPGSLISVLGANVRQGTSGLLTYPVLAASNQSSQMQVPFEATTGVFQLSLEGSTERWSVPLTVRDASPAIFVDAEGAPLLLDAASGLVMDTNVAVRAGSVVQILATGLGKVTPDWMTGVPAPLDSPPAVKGSVTAYLDGTPVQVTKATLAPGYVGYYIVELQIPAIVNRGASELRILMNGDESNRVKLYLESDRALR
jgi:uncharacterized protein (TIGR03437 family)